MYYLVSGLHFLYLIANPTPTIYVLFFCAFVQIVRYILLICLIISGLSPYKTRTFFVRKFAVCTKRHFVQKSTIRTVLYENRTVYKSLIYNVINTEKQAFVRKYKNISIFRQGIFIKRKNNKKEYIPASFRFCRSSAQLSKKFFWNERGGRGSGWRKTTAEVHTYLCRDDTPPRAFKNTPPNAFNDTPPHVITSRPHRMFATQTHTPEAGS